MGTVHRVLSKPVPCARVLSVRNVFSVENVGRSVGRSVGVLVDTFCWLVDSFLLIGSLWKRDRVFSDRFVVAELFR